MHVKIRGSYWPSLKEPSAAIGYRWKMAVVDELYIECTVRAKACLLSQTGQEITIGEAETVRM